MNQSPNSEQETPAPRSARTALIIVFLVVFIDLLGFGIVIPLLPRYAEEYTKPLNYSESVSGLIIAVLYCSFSAMQFIFAPLWGRLSDRIGRRPVLLIGLAGSVLSYAAFGFASELGSQQAKLALMFMFLARCGAGIAGATIATAQAVIADCTTRENRSRGMALIGAAFGIGFTFGPLIAWAGVSLAPQYRGGPGYLAAILSLLAFIYGYVKLPETRVLGKSGEHRSWLNLRRLLETLYLPSIGSLVLIFFLATFAFAGFEGTLSLLTQKALGYGEKSNYLLFAYIGFMLMLAQGYFYRKLSKTWDEIRLLRTGLILLFAGMVLISAITGFVEQIGKLAESLLPISFLFALAVTVFGFAFLTPSVQALISRRSDPQRQGEVLGVNQSFSALARILGPLLGLSLQPFSLIAPYLFSAGLLVLVALLAQRLNRV
ncbi:MFS transporter [Telmatocola sphagniphila]|uniref:MFS transporter n=1 Tax=Telmatocola sphagniphila TaxID=1123043 RepID=A0A8E6B9H4_9BACT|nr:MFS transporter [Telmatocola sphagniphila]QVL34680.1 MFS transporter [Telmatocola sphagniphila]